MEYREPKDLPESLKKVIEEYAQYLQEPLESRKIDKFPIWKPDKEE